MNLIKKCRVCGGSAGGFNYEGQISCESCKVFFCRNALKLETLTCIYNENCEIYISNRKDCPKCRLIKCFAIGMRKKCQQVVKVDDKAPTGADLILEIGIIKHISQCDIIQIADYVTKQCNLAQQMPKKRPPIELNRYELECLTEACNAIRVFRNENTAKVIKRAVCLQDLWDSSLFHNLLYIKKTIQFCQNFGAFNSLSSGDQLAVLKPFCFNLMQVWFAFQYETEKEGLLMFTNESENEAIFVGPEIVTSYKNQDIVQKMGNFSFSLINAMEGDVNIRNLLSTLLLFKTQSNLSCPENIRYHYYLYCTILQRYLQCKSHSRKEGNRKYLALMNVLERMDTQFVAHKKLLALEIGVHNMPTIVRDFYDFADFQEPN